MSTIELTANVKVDTSKGVLINAFSIEPKEFLLKDIDAIFIDDPFVKVQVDGENKNIQSFSVDDIKKGDVKRFVKNLAQFVRGVEELGEIYIRRSQIEDFFKDDHSIFVKLKGRDSILRVTSFNKFDNNKQFNEYKTKYIPVTVAGAGSSLVKLADDVILNESRRMVKIFRDNDDAKELNLDDITALYSLGGLSKNPESVYVLNGRKIIHIATFYDDEKDRCEECIKKFLMFRELTKIGFIYADTNYIDGFSASISRTGGGQYSVYASVNKVLLQVATAASVEEAAKIAEDYQNKF